MARSNLFNMQGVTLFSDASVFQDKQKAGFGAWAIGTNRKAILVSGPIKPFNKSINFCELAGLVQSYLFLADSYFIKGDEYCLFQCDSVNALMMLRDQANAEVLDHPDGCPITNKIFNSKCPRMVKGAKLVLEHSKQNNIKLFVRHVYGHRKGRGRQWVNNRCDKLARKAALRG